MKKIYFISDAHLGCRALGDTRPQEKKLVRFLEKIQADASSVYLMGDMIDFWFEYSTVVPKGFTRFLGALSKLTDSGIEVHYFIGNHDLWCRKYLQEECGVIMHFEPQTIQLGNHRFFLAHGDGMGDPDWKFRILRRIFHNPICQWAFSLIHPSWGMEFGLRWAKHSRLKHEPFLQEGQSTFNYLGENKEHLVLYAKDYLSTHPDINFFIFGHRHIELDLMLTRESRILILGDWISQFTYAVYDGETMSLENFEE